MSSNDASRHVPIPASKSSAASRKEPWLIFYPPILVHLSQLCLFFPSGWKPLGEEFVEGGILLEERDMAGGETVLSIISTKPHQIYTL